MTGSIEFEPKNNKIVRKLYSDLNYREFSE